MKALGRKFILRLEALDERALPSSSQPFVESHGTVTIHGDRNVNTIQISDDGTNNPGALFVMVDGQMYQSQGTVKHIVVESAGGADNVLYELNNEIDVRRTVDVDLGNQDDTFVASLHAAVGATGALKIFADGGNGDDKLSLESAGVDVHAGGLLVVGFEGGNGQDTLSTDYNGVLCGTAKFFSDGGNGQDSVVGRIVLSSYELTETSESFPSNGDLTAYFGGGNGKDDITLTVDGATDLTGLDAAVFGGHGKDTITTSANVVVHDRH